MFSGYNTQKRQRESGQTDAPYPKQARYDQQDTTDNSSEAPGDENVPPENDATELQKEKPSHVPARVALRKQVVVNDGGKYELSSSSPSHGTAIEPLVAPAPALAFDIYQSENETPQKRAPRRKIAADNALKRLLTRTKDQPKGIDMSLPPLSDINEIFMDITQKAVNKGILDVTTRFRGSKLRAATMCSGTESPLLALQMISESLKELGFGTIEVQHVFSAEIEPYKQAYIERNFAPPVIFRDITEFPRVVEDTCPMATTAYGSKADIPTDVDILIAGTSCVDYSALNNKRKGIQDGGESGQTWYGAFAYCRKFRPAIILFENVEKANWSAMIDCYEKIGYKCGGVLVTTKDYYIPQTRQRGYLACFDVSRDKENEANGTLGKKFQNLMAEFRRFASSPVSSFLIPSDQITVRNQLREDEPLREVDWTQSAQRHLKQRADGRLGEGRPFTRWSESGTITPPDTGCAAWFRKQPERVLDMLDISVLRKAKGGGKKGEDGYDVRYKHRIWDLSQNVDRFVDGGEFGISGCITPDGQPFVSGLTRALTAEEALMLQGIPLDKISFTTETEREQQDLAGNAMSTTVVGCAILSALITGHALIDPVASSVAMDVSMIEKSEMEQCDTHSVTQILGDIDYNHAKLLETARRTLRVCHCEGGRGFDIRPVQICIHCQHTTHVACGGNPDHAYSPYEIENGRLLPHIFEEQLKSSLPLRLVFCGRWDVGELAPESKTKCVQVDDYSSAVQQALGGIYSFSGIRRMHCWTAVFLSHHARLECVFEKNGTEWRLYALPNAKLPANSLLREWLREPIAKAKVTDSLLRVKWMWRIVPASVIEARIRSNGPEVPSWWARMEIPDPKYPSQPGRLEVEVTGAHGHLLEGRIDGLYRHLPDCSMACNSLYVRESDEEGGLPIYLFLDPTSTGPVKEDAFVFTHCKDYVEYDEVRPIIARVNPSWRPWHKPESPSTTLQVDHFLTGVFQGITLEATKEEVQLHTPLVAPHFSSCNTNHLLSGFSGPMSPALNQQRNQASNARFLREHVWAFEAMRTQISSEKWETLTVADSEVICPNCAPQRPTLRWSFGEDGLSISPYEESSQAATYERAMKSLPPPFIVKTSDYGEGLKLLELGINVTSLAHRAIARLTSAQDVTVKWMIDTSPVVPIPSLKVFHLLPTTEMKYTGPSPLKVNLFPCQLRCLNWMVKQESGAGVQFPMEESEEASLPALGWRAEVRASGLKSTKGGICADHPGFGKTVTTLALISLQQHESISMGSKQGGLMTSAATLVVCPASLIEQWLGEIRDKLGWNDGVISVNRVPDLHKYRIQDFAEAKVIVVNRAIFSSPPYAERLAVFAAMPGPATVSGRAYSEWLNHATLRIPEHLEMLEQKGTKEFQKFLENKYQQQVANDIFKAFVPSKRYRGSQADTKKNEKRTNKSKPKASNTTRADCALFEMFHFNRLVVDEFHEYNAKEYAAIKSLHADKRWGLCGTPALSDMYNVSQMAGLIGLPLRFSRDMRGGMRVSNRRQHMKDMTDFEKFDFNRQKMPSTKLHCRMYQLCQQFLDTFARQNAMDFEELSVEDRLFPIHLSLAHRALYMELSQHLISHEMQLRKGKRATNLEREKLVNEALDKLASAEEALLNAASFTEGVLDSQVSLRQRDVDRLTQNLRAAISRARNSDDHSRLLAWERTAVNGLALGDEQVIGKVRDLLDDKDINMDSDGNEEARTGRSALHLPTTVVTSLASQLVTAQRSLRFFARLQEFQSRLQCDKEHCPAKRGDMAISAVCGHVVCETCWKKIDAGRGYKCPARQCSSTMHHYNLLFGRTLPPSPSPTNAKTEAVVTLLRQIRSVDEQAILFLQYDPKSKQGKALLHHLTTTLQSHGIGAVSITDTTNVDTAVQTFYRNPQTTVLILNASSETAAGLNLQNANHVIFLSPLLKPTAYHYKAAMAQTIGRNRGAAYD
ncbi:hypothetical protein K470DRAFT_293732 [Piedraia hortae CBS 480.64]|uniref:Helicase ATP-binding domain-containing protein n=1 Tax=Piedraia hortae CBS 480.64 TaxID=1314780 RepID=A0A6A7C5E3_9PEZI|nr:hypothetical protein K470DRAFT_293732 [Piedraia hortae CBS 480.64]